MSELASEPMSQRVREALSERQRGSAVSAPALPAPGSAVTARPKASAPWSIVIPLAALMCFADGFWIISLREAAGAPIRTGRPFASWLADCTAVLPLFVLAVATALAIAYGRYGAVLRQTRTVVKTALIVALAGTLTGLVVAFASAGYDYYLQANEAEFVATTHVHTGAVSPTDPTCTGSCAVEQATLEVHARGLAYSVPLLLTTNVLLVGWTVALRGGRLDARRTRREPEPGR